MMHRQQIVEPAPRSDGAQSDSPRAVMQVERHEDVVHRVRRLRVKDGRLQVINNAMGNSLFAAK